MYNIEYKKISYEELSFGRIDLKGDDLGIVSSYLTEPVMKALLSNPSYNDASKSAMNLIICDGVIAGRFMIMQTRIKAGDTTFIAQSGGGIEINKNFRGKGLGRMLMNETFSNSEYPICMGQLYSSGAIAIVRKLNLIVFGKPLYAKLCKTRTLLAAKNMKGLPLKLCAFLGDLHLKFRDKRLKTRLRALKRKYTIKKETVIPEWTEALTLCDGHKYMEIHDREWLQWNLDNRFTVHPNDRNSFYTVYDKNNSPCGFFMTKERFEKNNDGVFKNLVRGTIVEWGSWNENELSEADLNLMAISTFSSNVDKINTVISSDGLDDVMKMMGFEYRGQYQMSLKADNILGSDMVDQNNWRIRYGGANTILV